MFENNGYLHVYSPRAGTDNPRGSNFEGQFFSFTVLFSQYSPLLQDFLKFSPLKRTGNPIRPCRKIGQGQPRVIIYIHFVKLKPPLIHAKFKDHRTSGSGEEDF